MKKVLFVDDEINTKKMKSRCELISDYGIEVIGISEVDEVIPLVKNQESQIGIIIIDLIMPPKDYFSLEETDNGLMTGILLCKKIRENGITIPILIYSVRDFPIFGEYKLQYNIDLILHKLISTSDMVKILKKYL